MKTLNKCQTCGEEWFVVHNCTGIPPVTARLMIEGLQEENRFLHEQVKELEQTVLNLMQELAEVRSVRT